MPVDTNLHKAAYKGDTNTVEDLLDAGDDINCRGAQSRTPLHRAVGKGHDNTVAVLLNRGADVNMVDGGGLSPLHWAALFGLVKTAQLLVEYKADINLPTKTGETPLHLSAEKGKLEFVKFLIKHGADIEAKDNGVDGKPCRTAYDSAKAAGQKEVLPFIKPAGAGACPCFGGGGSLNKDLQKNMAK